MACQKNSAKKFCASNALHIASCGKKNLVYKCVVNKEASILWSHHEETRELPGERDNARNNVRCTQARKATHGPDDNIKTWTGLSVEESIRMTEDRDKWRKYVHGVANPRIEDG